MGLQKNERLSLKGTWDFDVDGGAVGAYELVSVPADFRVEEVIYEVETAVTSGGTPTVELGDGDDADGYYADFQASMGATGIKGLNDDDRGAYLWDVANSVKDTKVYSAADTIDFTVGTAALTAGKINVYVYGVRLA